MNRPSATGRVRSFVRQHGLTIALASIAVAAAFGLSRGASQSSTPDWEAAAVQGGWSTATPVPIPDVPELRDQPAVAALPEAYRHIRPASTAAGPYTIPAAELWPAQ